MNRREFLMTIGIGSLMGASTIQSCRSKENSFELKEVSGLSSIGHLLRNEFQKPASYLEKEIDVLIIGGGIAGLSAARKLQNHISLKTELIELSTEIGGNAVGGKNKISAYPWAAHYLPIPSLDMHELIDFLKEIGCITSIENNIPTYNEDYLCFDNKERLYINGKWQEGLVPHFNLATTEIAEIDRFMKLVHSLRDQKDEEGRYFFDIPLSRSSQKNEWIQTNEISAYDWLIQNNYKSEAIHWYINYCTSDDFGSSHKQTSAWAMFHYFASRRGKATNATYDDVLTWPEGNHFLSKKMVESLTIPFHTNQLALQIEKTENGYAVYHLHTQTNEWTKTNCKHIVLNTPFQVANKLLPTMNLQSMKEKFNSYPWVIANITVKEMDEKNGLPLSWDNVIYGQNSLGFIHSNHQTLSRKISDNVYTYYKSINQESPGKARSILYDTPIEQIKNDILDELKLIYPTITENILSIEIKKIGHGMISPTPKFLFSPTLQFFAKPIQHIHFTHTDFCGMSIFEEAFYKGIEAAESILAYETN